MECQVNLVILLKRSLYFSQQSRLFSVKNATLHRHVSWRRVWIGAYEPRSPTLCQYVFHLKWTTCVLEHLYLRYSRLLSIPFLYFNSCSGRDESLKILRGSIPDYCPRVHVHEREAGIEWWQPTKWEDVRCSDGGWRALVEAKKRHHYSFSVPLRRMQQYYYFK